MKKRVAAIMLVVLMLLPALASCSKEVAPPEVEVTVYNLHMIKDESTTDEALKRVELALNRILFYRLGSCIEIIAYTEDEYYAAIEAKYAEMEEYKIKKEEEKKNNKNNKDKDKKEESEEVSVDVFTGDDYIDMLMNGEEYVREEPRFDIFLINDYEKYYELASEGMLADITAPLGSECKILKDYIHPTILSAAQISKKTYGVPLNTIIGEYSYVVFDKEYLEQHKVDYQTMQTMDDLQSYLALVAENNTDVVPLANSATPTSVDFIFEALSPAYVKNKYVYSSYESKEIATYYSVIQKFNALGYLREPAEGENAAVQFISGNEETIANLEKETGREYEYLVYSNPVATTQNCVNGMFAFSKYCTANELVAAMELVTAIYTNEELANIFAYGVEGENYLIDDNGQLERRNDTYMINPNYAGNRFITYTLAGEDADKWEKAKLQNLNATIAVDIGFKFQPEEFSWDYEDEDGEKQEFVLTGPDYIEIINEIAAKYLPAVMNGTALELDLDALYEEAELGIEDTLREALEKTYATRLQNNYSNSVSAKYSLDSADGKKIYNDAVTSVTTTLYTTVENELRTKYTKQFEEELASMYDDEEKLKKAVDEKVNALLTEDFINEEVERKYGEMKEELIMSQYNRDVQTKVDAALKTYISTANYLEAYEAAIVSDEFKQELQDALNSDLSSTINANVTELITTMMSDYFKTIVDEAEVALSEAIEEFVKEVVAKSAEFDGEEAMTEDEVRFELGLVVKETETDENDEVVSETYVPIDLTAYEYVMQVLTKQYYDMFGDPTVPS